MTTTNVLENVVVGTYGNPYILTIVDENGTAIDVSAYTGTMTVTARDPHGISKLTFTGSFVTTGTDGKIQFQPAAGNTFDREGDWEGQVQLTVSGKVAKTVKFTIEVGESLT